MANADELAEKLGIDWFDYQTEAFEKFDANRLKRICLFFRTGAGKTYTSLGCLRLEGCIAALVIAPPRIHDQWLAAAEAIGITIAVVSHEKFRMADYHPPKMPIIVDEFHQLGGLTGQGWKKLRTHTDRLADPVIIMSATPYWNSAERVFCAKRIVEGYGDYQKFIMDECWLEPNRYSKLPTVLGFRNYESTEEWMAAQAWTCYLPDTREIDIVDVEYPGYEPQELIDYGLNRRRNRIMASDMEERHVLRRFNLLDDEQFLRPEVFDVLVGLTGNATGPVVMYCNSSFIAEGVFSTLQYNSARAELLTGNVSPKKGSAILDRFKAGELDVLVGTATMRTGTDGLDRVCDTLIIIDDTEDDAARQQLIGRILPRGVEQPIDNKRVWRLVAT